MASPSSNFFPCSAAFILLLLMLTLVGICSHVRGEQRSHHQVDMSSLLPTEACSSFKDSASLINSTRLRVVHRHGPCAPLGRRWPTLSHKQILDQDRARVVSLHRRISTSTSAKLDMDVMQEQDSVETSEIPVNMGVDKSIGAGDYVVTVGFGIPKRDQTVIFDTGSDVTWIQCRPCVSYCYQQQDPIFDPSRSSTYSNISCSSAYCSQLDVSGCSSSTCLYGIQYGDNSYTIGFLAQDVLTLTSSDVIPNFRFGCGERNRGLFGKAAGLLGLGRDKPSLVSQAYQKHDGVFAYCLPPTSSSTGYLSFGRGASPSSSNVEFTPMLSDPNTPTFYYLDLQAISVAGQRLPVSATVFSKAGTIIDSGTVITRLPPTAYSALRLAFRRAMSGYKTAPALSILDTCYDLTRSRNVSIPAVALQFGGGVTMDLDSSGIVYAGSQSKICLAFAANDDDSEEGILGNVQQRTFEIVYDVAKKVIGFGPRGC